MAATARNLADQVLAFWFADALQSAQAAQARSKAWFSHDPDFDLEILKRFGHLPEQARAGKLDAWMQSARGALARLLVLDQFPRNLYRNDGRAYAFDPLALAGSQAAVACGHDAELHPLHAAFVYLPFEHAEDLAMQERSVTLFEALRGRAPAGWEPQFASYADYARRHRDVIARFGRFPHRNDVLGRSSTREELDYLEQGGERFGGKRR
jgi:uncharacterized protein (DUF924 family)